MKKHILITTSLTLFLASLVVFSSCRTKGDTIARITVRDTASMLVPNARVILYGTSTTDPIQPVVRRDTAFTNSSGVAVFNYNDIYQLGQAGFAVLDIIVRKDNMTGSGIIKVEEEKENTQTVFIQP
jgi:hypothetical protein